MGWFLGHWMSGYFPGVNATSFSLFIAAAISITAIPILGRIMIEFNLHRTQMGVLTITAAAIDDILGWTCLAAVSAIVASNFDPVSIVEMVVFTLIFALVVIKGIRPLLIRYVVPAVKKNNNRLDLTTFAIMLILIFGCAIATNKIGIFSLFGPFILGAAIYDQIELREAIFERLKDFITVFFLPIFFTYTGLHTDMGDLGAGSMWILLVALLFVSFFGKFVGCYVAAKLSGLPTKESACVGVMMNARALMGLIAANLGREMGAITPPVYCMLVIMCALSTIVTWPLLRRLIPGTEMGEAYMQSEYMVNKLRTASPVSG
jgi:Kef-type K+ transport system membrane component KefB